MNPITIALCATAATFGAGCLGLLLQRKLPAKYTTGPSKDMIAAVVGLLTLLSALVTGLLIWTAYGVYAGQNVAVQAFAARMLQEDLALGEYGADAGQERARLRESLARTRKEMWGARDDNDFVSRNYHAAIDNLRAGRAHLDSLRPSTDAQKSALTAANEAHASAGQTRLQMALALSDPVSYPLLAVVIGWVSLLFCGFGLMSRSNRMAFVVMAVGAAAVSSAVFVIVDLSGPYDGFFLVSPDPIERVMKDINSP